MKRLIACLLCAVMMLGMFAACGGSGGKEETKKVESFSVGYAKALISPKESVPLRGYGDAMERFSMGTLEPLYATCVAFADADGNTVLLISHDLTNSFTEVFSDLRSKIAEETGLPKSNVLFTASHSHSSPDMERNVPSILNYIEYVKTQCIQGAKDAIADLTPATMQTGFDRVDRVNTVRHYLLTDGSYQGKSVGTLPKSKLVGHYSKVDNLLQVVKFERGAEKKPVVLINWCGHPRGVEDSIYKMAGPNYVGVLREAVEKEFNCEASFVLSGSGNVNNGSQIEGEMDHETYIELGNLLADRVADIINGKLTDGKADKVNLVENMYTVKNKQGIDYPIPLYAFSIGDWACAVAPFEVFDTNVMAVRDASKYKMTFYATCANESLGYLPTPPSFGWLITYEAGITKFPQGTAEGVQEQMTQMLDQIFTASGNEIVDKGEGYNTPEFVPTTDDELYTNTDAGNNSYTAVQNGFYAIDLVKLGKGTKTMLCLNEEVAQKVAAQAAMKLLFNEQNVIVDVIPQ